MLKKLPFAIIAIVFLCSCVEQSNMKEIKDVTSFYENAEDNLGSEVSISGYLSVVPTLRIYKSEKAMNEYEIPDSIRIHSVHGFEYFSSLRCINKYVTVRAHVGKDQFTKDLILDGLNNLEIEYSSGELCYHHEIK